MRPQETVGLMVKATLLKKIIFFKKEVLPMYGLANSGTISENFRIFVVKLQKDNQNKPCLMLAFVLTVLLFGVFLFL